MRITRYVLAATLVRATDGGAIIAIVLLAQASEATGAIAGLLAACFTAPHLLGPFAARVCEAARDARFVFAGAAAVHGILLAAAGWALSTAFPGALVCACVALSASGLLGPILMGGFSSKLAFIAGQSETAQRRAQGWDVATYGLSGTLGPACVTWVAAAHGPLAALLTLAGSALIGALVMLFLPKLPAAQTRAETASPGAALRTIWKSPPLRRTLVLTCTVAFSVAMLPLYAVHIADTTATPMLAGLLTAGYGAGGLLGSLFLTVRPLRGRSELLVIAWSCYVPAALLVITASSEHWVLTAAFVIAGAANSCFFAATLAARSEHAPPRSRAQVFVWVGALKIGAASAGTAFAGATLNASVAATRPTLIALCVVASAICGVRFAAQLKRLG